MATWICRQYRRANGTQVRFSGKSSSHLDRSVRRVGGCLYPTGRDCRQSNRTIYVSDRPRHRVVLMNGSGNVTRILSQMNSPAGVAVSPSYLVVADSNRGQLALFDPTGNFLRAINLPQNRGDAAPQPYAVAFSTGGNIIVTDTQNGRILSFTPAGTLLYSYRNDGIVGLFNQLLGSLPVPLPIYIRRPSSISIFRNWILCRKP